MKPNETITVRKTESSTLTWDEIGSCCGVLTFFFFVGVGIGSCSVGSLVVLIWMLFGS